MNLTQVDNLLFAVGTTLMLGAAARAEPLVFQSAEHQVALLELFTSEGCSSCPPAEKWLSALKASPGLWKDFVPVAFHVDYWDYLGWRDPWASKEYSDRQHAYAQAWRSDSVYTPGFVLNAKEWDAWRREKNGPAVAAARAGVLRVSSTDRERWHVTFAPVKPRAGDYQVHAALLVSDVVSDVKAGENQGRRLYHDFVAVSLTTHLLAARGGKAEGDFELKPADKLQAKHLELAVWVTAPGSLEPLQAVGGRLSN